MIETERAEVQLSQDLIAIVDIEDYERISQFKWSATRLGNGWGYYAIRRNGNTSQLMHRFILNLQSGDPSVDHINMDGLDNRKNNLRLATSTDQRANLRNYGGSSQYKGVYWNKSRGKWIAQIYKDGKHIQLGSFNVEKDAAKAYDEEAKKLFGTFARVNI